MNNPKCIIFDVDGTLVDSLPLCAEAYRQALEPLINQRLSDEEIFAAFGPSEEGTVRAFVPDVDGSCVEQFLHHYRRLHPVLCPKPFDGIVDLLEELKSRGIPLAVVTGKGPKSLAITFDELGLAHYFDVVETGSPLRANKPESLRNVLHKFRLLPDEAVYIGDIPDDITACREVAMPVISAAWATTVELPKLQALNPDKIAHSVNELKMFLLGKS